MRRLHVQLLQTESALLIAHQALTTAIHHLWSTHVKNAQLALSQPHLVCQRVRIVQRTYRLPTLASHSVTHASLELLEYQPTPQHAFHVH